MKTFNLAAVAMVGLCIICAPGHAENWKKFFTNRAGINFFYEEDSLTFPDKNTVQIWYKSVPSETSEIKAWTEWLELREVDCTRRKYKVLQGRVIYPDKPMATLQESTSWNYLEPGELYDTFYRTACLQRKRVTSK